MAIKTILDLLKKGCTINFPSGYQLKGDPISGYIDTGYSTDGDQYYHDGLRILDKDGIRLALSDAAIFEQLLKDNG